MSNRLQRTVNFPQCLTVITITPALNLFSKSPACHNYSPQLPGLNHLLTPLPLSSPNSGQSLITLPSMLLKQLLCFPPPRQPSSSCTLMTGWVNSNKKKNTWTDAQACFKPINSFKPHYTPVSEKAMAPHSSTLAGKSHGWRSLVGCSPWGREKLNTTERPDFPFSLSCIGEGNGNPLQCSCLENPRDGGAWWAAVYEVAQSQTWLKRLSSSSSSSSITLSVLQDFFLHVGSNSI